MLFMKGQQYKWKKYPKWDKRKILREKRYFHGVKVQTNKDIIIFDKRNKSIPYKNGMIKEII